RVPRLSDPWMAPDPWQAFTRPRSAGHTPRRQAMTVTRNSARSSFTNLLGSSLLAAALIGLAAMEANSAEVPDFTTDISVDDIMAAIVMPSADILWTAVTVESTTEGIVETVPETEE